MFHFLDLEIFYHFGLFGTFSSSKWALNIIRRKSPFFYVPLFSIYFISDISVLYCRHFANIMILLQFFMKMWSFKVKKYFEISRNSYSYKFKSKVWCRSHVGARFIEFWVVSKGVIKAVSSIKRWRNTNFPFFPKNQNNTEAVRDTYFYVSLTRSILQKYIENAKFQGFWEYVPNFYEHFSWSFWC